MLYEPNTNKRIERIKCRWHLFNKSMLSIYKVNIEKKYSGLLLKGLKKCDPMLSHTLPSQSKTFFLSFYQNTNFRKKIKSTF